MYIFRYRLCRSANLFLMEVLSSQLIVITYFLSILQVLIPPQHPIRFHELYTFSRHFWKLLRSLRDTRLLLFFFFAYRKRLQNSSQGLYWSISCIFITGYTGFGHHVHRQLQPTFIWTSTVPSEIKLDPIFLETCPLIDSKILQHVTQPQFLTYSRFY